MRAAAAIAALAGSLALAGPAVGAAAARAPFAVALGAAVRISGTPLRCVASGTAVESGILCSLVGKDGKEPAGSLGVALSSRGEAIVVKFEPKGNRAVWRVKAARGASPSPSPATPRALGGAVHVTDVGGSWTVAGTDILCSVGRVELQPGLTCSRVDAGGPRKNSNSIAMTRLRVGIYRFDGSRHARMRVEEPQPARTTATRRLAARGASADRRASAVHRAPAARRAPAVHRLVAARLAAAPRVVEIGIGDTLRVAGSRVACAVTANSAKTGILCLLLATATAPLPRSYAVGLAEDGEAILVGYDKRGQGALVTRFAQGRARAARVARIIGARLGGVYRVRGTDIVCAVATTPRPAGVTCFMAGPSGRVIGSAGIAISDGVVARIFRVTSRTKVRSLVEKLQPAAR